MGTLSKLRVETSSGRSVSHAWQCRKEPGKSVVTFEPPTRLLQWTGAHYSCQRGSPGAPVTGSGERPQLWPGGCVRVGASGHCPAPNPACYSPRGGACAAREIANWVRSPATLSHARSPCDSQCVPTIDSTAVPFNSTGDAPNANGTRPARKIEIEVQDSGQVSCGAPGRGSLLAGLRRTASQRRHAPTDRGRRKLLDVPRRSRLYRDL